MTLAHPGRLRARRRRGEARLDAVAHRPGGHLVRRQDPPGPVRDVRDPRHGAADGRRPSSSTSSSATAPASRSPTASASTGRRTSRTTALARSGRRPWSLRSSRRARPRWRCSSALYVWLRPPPAPDDLTSPAVLLFRQFVDEDLGCASYLVGDRDAGVAVVVDPALAIEQYLEAAAEERRADRARARDAHARRPRLGPRPARARARAAGRDPSARRARVPVRAARRRRRSSSAGASGSASCTRPGTGPSTARSSSTASSC